MSTNMRGLASSLLSVAFIIIVIGSYVIVAQDAVTGVRIDQLCSGWPPEWLAQHGIGDLPQGGYFLAAEGATWQVLG